MKKQIFAWTGTTPTDGGSYASYLQVFHDTDGDKFTVALRGADGAHHEIVGDRAMACELTRLAIPLSDGNPI